MATYKVIQDIEAEDKLLGPLSLRQFIYAGIVIVQGFIAWKLLPVSPLLVIPFLPTMFFFGLLAAPFGQNQSSEVWLLAKIRFFLKPRKRIWDQSGMKQLVTITVPKHIEKQLTDGLTQSEVRSRLKALANTIDSRGWALKNSNVNLADPAFGMAGAMDSDRLVAPTAFPQEVPNYDITANDDIMDTSNTTAQTFDYMLDQSTQAHRQALMAVAQGQPLPDQNQQPGNWYMNQANFNDTPAGQAPYAEGQVIQPDAPIVTEEKPAETHKEPPKIKKLRRDKSKKHHETEAAKNDAHQPHAAPPQEPPKTINPELLRLADNDDLTVETIARQADKATGLDGEVVVNLRS